ncbi:unnamed protein product [Blepharisma stoltei]|uniref:Uncharacterized protein n=1 Tax=Blepharisma stoltei TaxID=1481888 RepID=A0AAU9J8C3_9CILI|nr:unnamed protein product [Blepharisma stoltei]
MWVAPPKPDSKWSFEFIILIYIGGPIKHWRIHGAVFKGVWKNLQQLMVYFGGSNRWFINAAFKMRHAKNHGSVGGFGWSLEVFWKLWSFVEICIF